MEHNVPIPFTERFPEPADCDKEGNFWSGRQTALGWRWIVDCNPVGAMSDGFTHWLPFNTQWLPAHSPVYKPEQGVIMVGPMKETTSMVPSDVQIDALVHDCLGEDGFDVRTVVRAALERWGCPAEAPADVEVAELVRWLRENADSAANADHHEPAGMLTFAADLLERPAEAPDVKKMVGPASAGWALMPPSLASGSTTEEVGELVTALRQVSDGANACGDEGTAWITARAANLIESILLHQR